MEGVLFTTGPATLEGEGEVIPVAALALRIKRFKESAMASQYGRRERREKGVFIDVCENGF
jgi:hypothetical protein